MNSFLKKIIKIFLTWSLTILFPLSITYYYLILNFLSITPNIDLRLIWTNYYYNGNLLIFKSYQIHLLLIFLLTILIFKTNDKKGKI
jgi:hypothetical protein